MDRNEERLAKKYKSRTQNRAVYCYKCKCYLLLPVGSLTLTKISVYWRYREVLERNHYFLIVTKKLFELSCSTSITEISSTHINFCLFNYWFVWDASSVYLLPTAVYSSSNVLFTRRSKLIFLNIAAHSHTVHKASFKLWHISETLLTTCDTTLQKVIVLITWVQPLTYKINSQIICKSNRFWILLWQVDIHGAVLFYVSVLCY